jgi:hypothetical protein
MSKIKKILGIDVKPRSREEVDKDYTFHAIQVGHKSRILRQIYADAERFKKEIEQHEDMLLTINSEGMKLPPVEPTPSIVAENKKTDGAKDV